MRRCKQGQKCPGLAWHTVGTHITFPFKGPPTTYFVSPVSCPVPLTVTPDYFLPEQESFRLSSLKTQAHDETLAPMRQHQRHILLYGDTMALPVAAWCQGPPGTASGPRDTGHHPNCLRWLSWGEGTTSCPERPHRLPSCMSSSRGSASVPEADVNVLEPSFRKGPGTQGDLGSRRCPDGRGWGH